MADLRTVGCLDRTEGSGPRRDRCRGFEFLCSHDLGSDLEGRAYRGRVGETEGAWRRF